MHALGVGSSTEEAPCTWVSATLRHLWWPAKRLVAVRPRSIPKQQGVNPRWEGILFENSAMGTPPVPCFRPALPADKPHTKPEKYNNVSWGGVQVALYFGLQGPISWLAPSEGSGLQRRHGRPWWR